MTKRKDIPAAPYTQGKGLFGQTLWSGFAGIVFGLFELIAVVIVLRNLPFDEVNTGLKTLRIAIFFAGFVTGTLGWWLLICKAERITLRRGIWSGMLIALATHLAAACLRLFLPGSGTVLPSTFIQGLLTGLFNTLSSIITLGWATIPIGGIIGGFLSYWQAKMWGISREFKPFKKSSLKIFKIVGITVGIIYLISGLIMLRSCLIRKQPEPFQGWLYYWNGPYIGKVVELDTGRPIEGAVVAGNWHLEVFPGWPMFCDAVETTTDKNGEFVLPRAWCISLWPIAKLNIYSNPVVFKPGYLGYPPSGLSSDEIRARMPNYTGREFRDRNQYYIIELGRPKTREERLDSLREAEDILNFLDGYKKLPKLLKITDEENKTLKLPYQRRVWK